MSVANGQNVDAPVSNAAFMSRTVDTSTVGRVDLNNVVGASGASITNVQRELNGLNSFTGSTPNSVSTRTPSWSTSAVGTSGDNLQERSEALTTQVATNTTSISSNTTNKVNKAASSTDNAIARFNGAVGDTIQNSGVTIDDSDNVIIPGNLTVQGTRTFANTATLDVTDANITVNKGGNQASANAADSGLTVEMSDATDVLIGYDSTTTSRWKCGDVGSELEIATISHIQIMTNKDYDGGTATAASRMTMSKETLANLTGLARKQGTVYYDTTNNVLVFDDGSALNALATGAAAATDSDQNILAVQVFS